MAGHLMLLNPKGRRRRRKMTAKQLKYFGPRRSKKHKRRAAAKVVVVSSNPRRRRRRSHVVTRKMRRNPKMTVKTLRRRFRRNPISSGFLSSTLAPAAVGAAGAIGTDYVLNMLSPYIPPSLNTPLMAPVLRIGAALLVGMGVDALAGSKAGTEAAAGGVVVALYNFASQQLLAGGMGMGGGYAGGYAYNGAGQGAGAYGLNRYLGFQPRGQRRMNGVPAVRNLSPVNARPQLGGNNNVTKFRQMRAQGGGGMGYIGPAPTMGRYLGNGR